MSQKKVAEISPKSEEFVATEFVAYAMPKRRNGFSKGWVAMANDAFGLLKQIKSVEDFRVLMALLEQLDYENLITANQAEIARDLDMQRQNVQGAIKRLVQIGALLVGPKVGVSRTFRLNPDFGWKGTAKNHITALDEVRQQRMQAAGITGIIGGGRQADPGRDTSTADMFEDMPA